MNWFIIYKRDPSVSLFCGVKYKIVALPSDTGTFSVSSSLTGLMSDRLNCSKTKCYFSPLWIGWIFSYLGNVKHVDLAFRLRKVPQNVIPTLSWLRHKKLIATLTKPYHLETKLNNMRGPIHRQVDTISNVSRTLLKKNDLLPFLTLSVLW